MEERDARGEPDTCGGEGEGRRERGKKWEKEGRTGRMKRRWRTTK